jgi:hypothetical protein
MSYFNIPAVPQVQPASYTAPAPERAKPPNATPAPKTPEPTHGPAVILSGALARPAGHSARQDPEPPKPTHHINRVI